MAEVGVSELAERIGWQGALRVDGMSVGVCVTDVRRSFGRVDYKVEPLYGEGESAWLSSVRFAKYAASATAEDEPVEQDLTQDGDGSDGHTQDEG